MEGIQGSRRGRRRCEDVRSGWKRGWEEVGGGPKTPGS